MDPVSLAASIAGLGAFVAKVVSTTYNYSKSMIGAKATVKCFLKELQDLSITLEQLQSTVSNTDPSSPNYPQASARLINTVNECLKSIKELSQKLGKRHGQFKAAFRLLAWPLTESDTLAAINTLARHKQTFALALNMDTWKLASLTLSAVTNDGQKQEAFRHASKSETILAWLSSFDHQKRYDVIWRKRAPNTGEWLLQSNEFLEFEKNAKSSKSLWCHGIPGAGKSFIAATVINHISTMPDKRDKIALIYHFFDYHTAADQSSDLICGSFLKQLAYQVSLSTIPQIENLYEHCKKNNTMPDKDDLLPIILSLLERFEATYVVIDALDECAEDYQNPVRDMIAQLRVAGVNMLITAREHIEPIDTEGYKWSYVEVKPQGEDIEQLFNDILKKKRAEKRIGPDPAFRKEVVEAVIDNANGMFLLAFLHISHILEQRTIASMRHALEHMPSGINQVFDDTLKRMGNNDLARRTLAWLALATEPLDVKALSHALSIDLESPTEGVDKWNIPAREDLIELCCGLVMEGGDGSLRFVHFTVKEYFEEHPERLLPFDNRFIVKSCLWYLSLKEFESGYCDNEDKILHRLQEYPFYAFAARRWADYLPEMETTERRQIDEAMLKVYNHRGLFSSYAQVHYSQYSKAPEMLKYFEFHKGYTPLHNSVELGLAHAAKKLLEKGNNHSAQTIEGVTPLHLAVEAEREDLVRMLLSAGASKSIVAKFGIARGDGIPPRTARKATPDKRTGRRYWIYSSDNFCPVKLAGFLRYPAILGMLQDGVNDDVMGGTLECITEGYDGQEEMVKQILDAYPSIDHRHPAFGKAVLNSATHREGFVFRVLMDARPEVDDRDGVLTRALPTFAYCRPEYVETLVQKGACINGPVPDPEEVYLSEYELRPLSRVLETNNEDVARFLIEQGAELSHPDTLRLAVEAGMESIVELILDRGFTSNVTAGGLYTPLSGAAKQGNASMVKLLLNRGTNIDAGPNGGLSIALACTAEHGHVAAAKVLIDYGADVNVKHIIDPPIVAAVKKGKKEYVSFLLDHGANVNLVSEGTLYVTALSEAVESGFPDLCELLLSRGADPNLSTWFSLPLMLACNGSHLEIAKMLLKHGAEPNARTGLKNSYALEVAVHEGNKELVQLLLNFGADLHARGGTYGSVLHAAVSSPKPDMARVMINHGAKVFEDDERYGGLLHTAKKRDYDLLIEQRADVNAYGGKYGNALQAAIARDVRFESGLSYVDDEERTEAVQHLLQAGANINAIGGIYHTALQAAARVGDRSVVALLLRYGADINLEGGRYGSPLQAAAYRGRESVVESLLQAGANINQQCGRYRTALQAASFRGHEAIVRLLLAHGADVNTQGGKYNNALRAARREIDNVHKTVVEKILLDNGAVDSYVPHPRPMSNPWSDFLVMQKHFSLKHRVSYPNLSDSDSDSDSLI